MRRRFGQYSDSKREDTEAMEDDRSVVEVPEDVDSKSVDHAMGNEQGGIYPQRPCSRCFEPFH